MFEGFDFTKFTKLKIINYKAFFECGYMSEAIKYPIDLSKCTELAELGAYNGNYYNFKYYGYHSPILYIDISNTKLITIPGESFYYVGDELSAQYIKIDNNPQLTTISSSVFDFFGRNSPYFTSISITNCPNLASIGASAFYGSMNTRRCRIIIDEVTANAITELDNYAFGTSIKEIQPLNLEDNNE